MDRRVKERLVGASILAALIVLIVPELLSGPPPASVNPSSGLPVSAPQPVRNVTVDLATRKVPPEPEPEPEAPASSAAPDAREGAPSAAAETAADVPAAVPPAPSPRAAPGTDAGTNAGTRAPAPSSL